MWVRLSAFLSISFISLAEPCSADCASEILRLGQSPELQALSRRMTQAQEIAMLEYRVLVRGLNLSYGLNLEASVEELALQASYARTAELLKILDELQEREATGQGVITQRERDWIESEALENTVKIMANSTFHTIPTSTAAANTGNFIFSSFIRGHDEPWAPRWSFTKRESPHGGSLYTAHNDAQHLESEPPAQYLKVLDLIHVPRPNFRPRVRESNTTPRPSGLVRTLPR